MKQVKVKLTFEWVINEKEWNDLLIWDRETVEAKVKERLGFDPVSSFYSLSQISVPDPTEVKVTLLPQ